MRFVVSYSCTGRCQARGAGARKEPPEGGYQRVRVGRPAAAWGVCRGLLLVAYSASSQGYSPTTLSLPTFRAKLD